MNINQAAIMSTMTTLADITHPDFAALGVTKTDFEKTTGEISWQGKDRLAVLNTFKSIVYSATDALALDRVVLPPEFLAAAICTIVAPRNWMVACHWIVQELKTGKPILSPDGEEVGFAQCTISTMMHLVSEGGSNEAAKGSRERMVSKMQTKKA